MTGDRTGLVRAWQCQSLLLGYPDEAFFARLDLLDAAAAGLDDRVGAPLRRFVAHVRDTPPVNWPPTTSPRSTSAGAVACSSPTTRTGTPVTGGWRCCG
ncbi:hypothetical protein [Micromonospora zhanjiangensis]